MNTRKLSEIAIIFMGIVLLVFLLKEFQSFLRPFVIAVILTFLFVPFTRLSVKRRHSILFGTLSAIALLSVVIFGVTYLISDSAVTENTNIGFTDKLIGLVSEDIDLFGNSFSLTSLIDPAKIGEMISKTFSVLFSSTTSFISELFIIILFVSFLLPVHDIWVNKIKNSLSGENKKLFRNTMELVEQSIRDYLYVKSIVSFGTAGVSFLFMMSFGVEYAALFALMIFALNFVPNIGSILAVGIVGLSHFVNSGFGVSFVVLLVLLIVTQIIFGNVVEPKFAGSKLDVSPVLILLSLFFWGSIWGIGGMLFSVPLTVIIKIVLTKVLNSNSFK
ncbi:MAG: AI-2E family transporter [Nanoarchaeales archaeon]|nr:AI-2E family transporter [Nanoarchaeales archaeon]